MKYVFSIFFPILLLGVGLKFIEPKDLNLGMENPSLAADGPYVLYRNEQVIAKYIKDKNGVPSIWTDSVILARKSELSLKVHTDIPGKTFQVKLKDKLENEPAEFSNVNKLLAISDIEGSFAAFRKLLQVNKVIDADFNWTFGNGHLVLTGDFVDRGEQVTEVLWLIYSLEEKAKAAGGYVHFVLGNHEIMNMSGDLRYLHRKYVDNATLLNEKFEMLYGEHSELGRWFRTKNIAEKVGDILFVHGGISALVNSMQISLPDINKISRPFYADSLYKYPDPRLDTLYSDWGPFWYRGYYAGTARASQQQVDSTLQKFGIKHIATGHTVIADTVSVLFGGKLFNTDVYHSKGISEALLMEGSKFYRVNAGGEKFLLTPG